MVILLKRKKISS